MREVPVRVNARNARQTRRLVDERYRRFGDKRERDLGDRSVGVGSWELAKVTGSAFRGATCYVCQPEFLSFSLGVGVAILRGTSERPITQTSQAEVHNSSTRLDKLRDVLLRTFVRRLILWLHPLS
jgi:hypothetical protein